jgi:predicted transcriptional regulator
MKLQERDVRRQGPVKRSSDNRHGDACILLRKHELSALSSAKIQIRNDEHRRRNLRRLHFDTRWKRTLRSTGRCQRFGRSRDRSEGEAVNRSETADKMPKPRAKASPDAIRPPLVGYDSQGSQMPSSWASSHFSSSSNGEVVLSSKRPRSALKIHLEILEIVRDEVPSKPTKIMLMANLPRERFARYLKDLVSQGLLEENRDSAAKVYTLTAKGLDFANRMKEVENFVATFQLAI